MSVTNKQIDTNNLRELPPILREMRFTSMARKLEEALEDPSSNLYAVSGELIDLVLSEYNSRCTNKINKYIKKATLKIPGADLEDMYEEGKYNRQMNMNLLNELKTCNWISRKNNLIITGPSGTGKTWIACALAICACEKFMNVRFYSTSKLILEMKTLEPNTYLERLQEIQKLDLLILDDIGYMSYDLESCRIFFEILDTRYMVGSTMLVSNFTTSEWYDLFADHSYGEATLSRIVEKAFRLTITGEDLRPKQEMSND